MKRAVIKLASGSVAKTPWYEDDDPIVQEYINTMEADSIDPDDCSKVTVDLGNGKTNEVLIVGRSIQSLWINEKEPEPLSVWDKISLWLIEAQHEGRIPVFY